MTEEGLNAAVLRLQSLAIETYGRIKDIYRREQQDGDVDTISSLSMKLANYEGALLTLQQYKQNIIDSARVVEDEEEPEPEEVDEDSSSVITEDQLRETSESFKRSIAHKRVGVKEVDES